MKPNTISHIDHIAIVVKNISQAKSFYEEALGLKIINVEEMPTRGIRTAFIQIGQTKIELIEPMHENSEVSSYLEKRGPGIHHIAFKTTNIEETSACVTQQGAQLTYAKPQLGAHNTKINFIHPKSSGGVLMELVE